MLTDAQVQAFHRDGCVLIEGLFGVDEVAALLEHADDTQRASSDLRDAEGRSSTLSLWSAIEDDVFGAATRSVRIVDGARRLLGEDVYHWHSKIMRKEPRVGGAWEWHQDYGYWYKGGCIYPRLISCMVALDHASVANGCLRVIPGSHLAGRIEHGGRGEQTGADPARVEAIRSRLGTRHCEMPAGSALFFHCNLLHGSEANTSDTPRRAFICCYNAFSNVPVGGGSYGPPAPIAVAEDDDLLRVAATTRRSQVR